MGRRLRHFCDWPDCGKSYDRPAKLAEHKKSHLNTRDFECPEEGCGKAFSRKAHLQRHQHLIHSGQSSKPFNCDQCDKSFALEHQLKRHVLTHQRSPEPIPSSSRSKTKNTASPPGVRIILCGEPNCNYQTGSKPELLDHRRTEHKVDPQKADAKSSLFHCTYEGCTKVFSRKFALKTHQNIAHLGKRPFECPICQDCFGYKKSLDRHIRLIHEKDQAGDHDGVDIDKVTDEEDDVLDLSGLAYEVERPFPCPSCRHRFLRKYDLDRHLKACNATKT